MEKIANLCRAHGIAGIVATNTTANFNQIINRGNISIGGLSGIPLFKKSTQVLARIASITEGEIPLIGVGGIASGKDAFIKISAGASAVQLYTALIYKGPSLVLKILADLNEILLSYGFHNVEEAVGINKHNLL